MNHFLLGTFGGPTGRSVGVFAAALLAVSILGCGQSPEPEPAPAPPSATPAPTEAEPAAPPVTTTQERTPGEPPGGLELPTDFNPQSQDAPTGSADGGAGNAGGGFQMPTQPDGVQAPAPTTSSEPATADEPAADGAPAADGDVSLQAAPWDEMSAAITDAGRITVVDVWSLACEPCLKEFPGLVAMHRDLGDRVACFSVNTDYDGRKTKPAESYRPRVEAFLESVGATFPNFLSETPSDDLFSELGILSIPAVLIYDADGKLVRTFSDVGADAGFTYADNILPFVQELLAQNR